LKPEDSRLIEDSLNLLSPRWTTAVLIELSQGSRRTTQLLRSLPGLSAKTLTERLRKLQEYRMITRTTFNEVPPRVEYALTDSGREALKLLISLKRLSAHWSENGNGKPE